MEMAGYKPEKHNKKPLSKKAGRIRKIITGILLAIVISFFTTDYIRIKIHSHPPIFCIPIIRYEHGSVDYYGAGYKIWEDYDPFEDTSVYYVTLWILPKFWSI